jgi:hypothetical protein
MGDLITDIVEAIKNSLSSNSEELQQKLELKDALPIQILGNNITFTIPKAQKLDGLLSQPNYTRVPDTERKKKDGTTVSVRGHKRRTTKPTLTKVIEACEADEADVQKTTDVMSEFITQRIQIGLGNLKASSL